MLAAVLSWRMRVLAMIIPAGLVLFAAIASTPEPKQPPIAPTVAQNDASPCVPIAALHTVKDLNQLVERLRGGGEFQGADVGADVTLQDGRQLWVFGDTLRARDFEGQRFVRNSMLIFTDRCARAVIPADHGALIPDRSDGVGYWPMSIAKVERPGYDLVGVAVQRVRGKADPQNPTDFENLGPAIAVFVVRPGEAPQLITAADIGADNPSRKQPTWGAAAAVKDDWVYLYGTANPETPGIFGWSLQVARVRADDILERKKWRFWDGQDWQRDAKRAKVLIGAEGGVSQTLSVFNRAGRWYAISKRDDFLGQDLVIWTAPAPTGPFTPSPALATIGSDAATGMLRYMPLAHPNLLPKKDSVVVSVSQNNTDIAKIDRNPFLYRPRFLRVPLPR